ncbi:MAG: polysaccharide pyruvyl transferase family protein [Magnetococcales bacterium]|nr:polysaccharide pyruvyl transferase family protein [Magnetococcales bacterium]
MGHGNFGDEAMALALRLYLKRRLNHTRLSYYDVGEIPLFQQPDDLAFDALHRVATPRKIKQLLDRLYLDRFGTILLGGGGILHSENSISWKLKIIDRLKRRHPTRPTGAVSMTLGPFKTDGARKLCQKLLQRLDFFHCRDQPSAALAQSLNPQLEIFSSFDISLTLPTLCPEKWPASHTKSEAGPVGLFLFKHAAREGISSQNPLEKKQLRLVNEILARGRKVQLFTIYLGQGCLDASLNHFLKAQSADPEGVSIHTFDGDIFRTIQAMQRCEAVVSMRYHGAVFAHLLGIPYLSLAYTPKNSWFIRTMGYPEEMDLAFHNPDAPFEPVLAGIEGLFQQGKQLYDHTVPLERAMAATREDMERVMERLA